MLSIFRSKFGYSSVEDNIDEEDLKLGNDSYHHSNGVTVKIGPNSVLLLAVLLLSSIVSTWIQAFNTRLPLLQKTVTPTSHEPSWVCQRPTTRREWRTLSEPERLDYVAAVKCLAHRPSKLHNNGTLYDDFPWVHKELSSIGAFVDFIGSFPLTCKLRTIVDKCLPSVHVSAPFLPWHRYYIYLYEKALKEECAFNNDLA